KKLGARAHRTQLRIAEELCAMPRVIGPEPFGHEYFDRLIEQLRSRVSEQALGLRVYQNDFSRAVDDDHGVGRGLQQSAELLFRPLAVADIANRAHHQRALLGFQGAKTDFHRKFESILAPAVE